MAIFNRNKNLHNNVNNDYLQATDTVSRPMALIFTLLIIFVVAALAFSLFLGGRWLYQNLDGSDQPQISQVVANPITATPPSAASTTTEADKSSSSSSSGSTSTQGSTSSATTTQTSGSTAPTSTTSQSATATSSTTSSPTTTSNATNAAVPATGASQPETIPATGTAHTFMIFIATVVIATLAHNILIRRNAQ